MISAKAAAALETTHYARGRAVYAVSCDGCEASFEGTNAELRASRWVRRWRRAVPSGVREQIDLCPTCRRGRGVWPPRKRG